MSMKIRIHQIFAVRGKSSLVPIWNFQIGKRRIDPRQQINAERIPCTVCGIWEADNPRKSSFSPVNSYWNWTKRRLASTALLSKSDTLGCCRHMVLEQLRLSKIRHLARTVFIRCARQEVLDNLCCSNAIHGQPVYAQIAQNDSRLTGDGEERAVSRCL